MTTTTAPVDLQSAGTSIRNRLNSLEGKFNSSGDSLSAERDSIGNVIAEKYPRFEKYGAQRDRDSSKPTYGLS